MFRKRTAIFFLSLLLCHTCNCTSLSVVQRIESLWGNIAYDAAEVSLKAVEKQTGLKLTLRDVPLDTFKVFIGRQHQLGVEVDGVQYDVSLSSEVTVENEVKALPDSNSPGSSLVDADWWQMRKQGGIPLPDITLAGPLELLLGRPVPVSAYLPHAADVGEARRIILAPGSLVTVRGLKALSLRRPLELPRLPGQYLAEVYAHVKLGESEQGYGSSPGILFLAQELQAAAANLSAGAGASMGQRAGGVLLSLDAEAVAGSVTIMAAAERPREAVMRLRARRLSDGSLELSPRQASELQTAAASQLAAAQEPWAWPLPGVALAQWVPYESLLRSILASHPFDLQKVQQQGVGLRLTRSSLRGVSLIAFDMHVRGQVPKELKEGGQAQDGWAEDRGEDGVHRSAGLSDAVAPLEVWQVMVQLKEKEGGEWEYHPMNAKRKEVYSSTITLSPTAQDALQGNVTGVPLGLDHQDLGLARGDAAAAP